MAPKFQPKPVNKPIVATGPTGGLKRHLGQHSDEPVFGRVTLDKIRPNPAQARKVFKDEDIKSLAQSVDEYGLQQPIVLKRIDEDSYELVAGERRVRAHQLLGKTDIYAVVTPKNTDSRELGLLENLQRVGLDSVELAQGLQSLLEANEGYTHERVGAIVGMSKDTVTRILGILKLPEHMLTEYHEVTEVVSLTTLVDLSRKVGVVEGAVLEDMWQRAKKGKLPRGDIRKPAEQVSPVERNLRTLTTTVTALTQAKEKGIMSAADISRLKALRNMINGLLE